MRPSWDGAYPFLLVLAAGLVLVLAVQNRSLRAQHQALGEVLASPQPGMWIPVLDAETIHGGWLTVGEASGPQVLLFFTTTCEYSRASLPLWAALHRRVAADATAEVVGVSFHDREATLAFVRELEVPFPVVTFPHRRWAELFRIRGVPQVIVATPEGRVTGAWRGAMDEEAIMEILDAVERAGRAPLATESEESLQLQVPPETGGVP
jgi:peroxiredoxin